MNVESIAAMNVFKMKKEELTSHSYCYRLHGIFNVYLFVQCNLLIVAGEMLQSRGSLRDLCNYFLGGDGKTEFQLKKYQWNYKIYGKYEGCIWDVKSRGTSVLGNGTAASPSLP